MPNTEIDWKCVKCEPFKMDVQRGWSSRTFFCWLLAKDFSPLFFVFNFMASRLRISPLWDERYLLSHLVCTDVDLAPLRSPTITLWRCSGPALNPAVWDGLPKSLPADIKPDPVVQAVLFGLWCTSDQIPAAKLGKLNRKSSSVWLHQESHYLWKNLDFTPEFEATQEQKWLPVVPGPSLFD